MTKPAGPSTPWDFSTPDQAAPPPSNGPAASEDFDFSDNPDNTPKGPRIGRLEAFARGAGDMFTLGYEPQINAALGTLSGQSYEQNLARERAKNAAAGNQHPFEHGAGMVAGAAAPIALDVLTGGAAAPEEAGALAASGSFGNIASLGGKGLRALAGAAPGEVAPALLKGAAGVAENPLTQGALMGASNADDTEDALKGAAAGAVGAKLGELGMKGAGALAKGAGKALLAPVAKLFTSDMSAAQIAARAAHEIGVSLPYAATVNHLSQNIANKFDPFSQVPKASAQTLSELGDTISQVAPRTDPEDAGNSILGSVRDWLSNGAQKEINTHYEPVKGLEDGTGNFRLSNLRETLDDLRNTTGRITDIEPTLSIVSRALENPEGLSMAEMRQVRSMIDKQRVFNKLPGSQNLDDKALSDMRGALTADMHDAARMIGGNDAAAALAAADKNASGVYARMHDIAQTIRPNSPTQSGAAITRMIRNAANINTANTATLAKIKSVVSPQAWEDAANTYAQSLAPNGQFSFGNFAKQWSSISPQAKDLLFGEAGQGGKRDIFENIAKMGVGGVGNKIDQYASNYGAIPSDVNLGSLATSASIEAARSGIPFKTIAGTGVAGLIGRKGAQNVAATAPSTPVGATIMNAIKTNPQASAAMQAAQKALIDPALKGTQVGADITNKALIQAARAIGAQTGAAVQPHALQALLVGGMGAIDMAKHLPLGAVREGYEEQASGGRIERASGGKVQDVRRHEYLVSRLLNAAKDAKKATDKTTEPLLNVPDEHIVKALDVAQRAI